MSNKLFVIFGPSGSGQDSVIEGLEKILPVERVVTTTSRPRRPSESQKRPYYFISQAEFKKRIKQNEFFEYAQAYNNNYYGVTKKEISRVKSSKKIGIWKTEYKGMLTIKKLLPDITAILINAPLKILMQRIKTRDEERATPQFIKERLAYIKQGYLKELPKYRSLVDFEVTNEQGKLEEAVKRVARIINKLCGKNKL